MPPIVWWKLVELNLELGKDLHAIDQLEKRLKKNNRKNTGIPHPRIERIELTYPAYKAKKDILAKSVEIWTFHAC